MPGLDSNDMDRPWIASDRARLATRAGRLAAVGLVLSACPARPTPPHSTAAPPEPTAAPPAPSSAADSKLADADTSLAAFGPGPVEVAGPLGHGQLALDGDERVLTLAGVSLTRLAGPGEPCTVAPSDVPLAVFEGPEAVLLYASPHPRFVGLTEAEHAARCWSIDDPLELVSLDEPVAKPKPRTGILGLSYFEEDGELPMSDTVVLQLDPEVSGEEELELVYGDDTLSLELRSAAGERLMAWSETLECESLDAEVWSSRLDQGLALELVYGCSDCPACKHGWTDTKAHLRMWQPSHGPLHVGQSRSHIQHGDEPDTEDEDQRQTHDRNSWRLGAGVLHHERSTDEVETEEAWCTDPEASEPAQCCRRHSSRSSHEQSWTLELAGHEDLTRSFPAQPQDLGPELSCEPAD